jgi:DNA-directed RNA polymerase specialized sigma24 family protein
MAMTTAPGNEPTRWTLVSDPALSAAVTRVVRGRVPAADVDDIVQSTLADALAARQAPEDAAEFRRWVLGVARNKIADFYRRSRREVPRDPSTTEETEAAGCVSQGGHDLLRWAERELPKTEGAESTLEWMLREGEGEKLESIAAEAQIPAPRVRQRVARLRRHYRARWAAQLAAVAAILALILIAFLAWRSRRDDVVRPLPRPVPSPSMTPDLPPPLFIPEEPAVPTPSPSPSSSAPSPVPSSSAWPVPTPTPTPRRAKPPPRAVPNASSTSAFPASTESPKPQAPKWPGSSSRSEFRDLPPLAQK